MLETICGGFNVLSDANDHRFFFAALLAAGPLRRTTRAFDEGTAGGHEKQISRDDLDFLRGEFSSAINDVSGGESDDEAGYPALISFDGGESGVSINPDDEVMGRMGVLKAWLAGHQGEQPNDDFDATMAEHNSGRLVSAMLSERGPVRFPEDDIWHERGFLRERKGLVDDEDFCERLVDDAESFSENLYYFEDDAFLTHPLLRRVMISSSFVEGDACTCSFVRAMISIWAFRWREPDNCHKLLEGVAVDLAAAPGEGAACRDDVVSSSWAAARNPYDRNGEVFGAELRSALSDRCGFFSCDGSLVSSKKTVLPLQIAIALVLFLSLRKIPHLSHI
jgi:hypothetical protein